MINILGLKRVIGILVLFVLCGAVGATLFFYVLPHKEKVERDLRVTKASVAASRAEIEKLHQDITFFEEQKNLYENLVSIGFFSDQDRFDAQKRIEAIQDRANILRMHYNISPARVKENAYAANADHVVLTTAVTVDVDALDDVDFYSFMYWLDNAFTGQSSITGFDIERVLDVNDTTLRQIGSGNPVPLLKGSVDFEWRTLIPRESYVEGEEEPS